MSPRTQNTGPALVEHSVPFPAEKRRAGAEGGSSKGHSYKPLPKEFRRDGFTYRQIAREDDVAIYEQTWNGHPDSAARYEVVRIRRRGAFEIHGRFVEPAEIYPPSEAWGLDGFMVTDRDKAWAKFFEIFAGRTSKERKEIKNGKIVQKIRRQC